MKEELGLLGMDCEYMELPVAMDDGEKWDSNWDGVRNRYWFQRTYKLPIAYFKDAEDDGEKI